MPSVLAQTERNVEWIVVDDEAARKVTMPTETDPTGLVAAQYRRILGQTQTQLRMQEGVLP